MATLFRSNLTLMTIKHYEIRKSYLSIKLNYYKQCQYFVSSAMNHPIVTTKYGKIQGAQETLFDSSSFFSFMGIPYAQPPVGNLRFKAPLPLKPWTGIYDATKHGAVCPQFDMQSLESLDGNEDCLFLNVYTRSLNPDVKAPVMVFLHGGGFMSGSGNTDIYGPRFLLQHDVVLVTLNYRLGLLGFLCLDTPEVPGNAGMKDQVAALQWVQDNIINFGGNPNNVTIFGESAGAASVTYHLFSPMSRGLFHKAIAQSGVCLTDWAVGKDGKERAFRAGNLLGKDTKDTDELLDFLLKVPAPKLAALSMKTGFKDERHRGLPIHLAPVVEKKFNNVAFLECSPLKLLQSGQFYKVPLIVGYNSCEGLFMAKRLLKKRDFYNKYPSYFIPRELVERISKDKLEEFGHKLKMFYFKDDLGPDDVEKMAHINSDLHFVYGAYRFANYFAKHISTYMYRFDCVTELNFLKNVLDLSQYKGVCHVDELFYMFDNVMNKDIYEENPECKRLINMVTKLWTDFAKTGNPTPDQIFNVKWSPYTRTDREYLNIQPQLSMGRNDERERVEFLTKLYDEAGLSSLENCKL